MMNAHDTLKKEFIGENNSFIFMLRGEFVWDKRLFSELVTAMRLICEESENNELIEKWIAGVFWYMAIFVREHTMHPEFPKPHDLDYYLRAFAVIEELGEWLFTGSCPVLNKDTSFDI